MKTPESASKTPPIFIPLSRVGEAVWNPIIICFIKMFLLIVVNEKKVRKKMYFRKIVELN